MRSEIAFAESTTSSCNLESFPVFSAFPTHDVMTRSWLLLRPLLAGVILTLLQLAMAMGLLAPDGPFSYRYSTPVEQGRSWFMNIVDRRYRTIVRPSDPKLR